MINSLAMKTGYWFVHGKTQKLKWSGEENSSNITASDAEHAVLFFREDYPYAVIDTVTLLYEYEEGQ